MFQTDVQFLQAVQFHVRAVVAGAGRIVGRRRDKYFAGTRFYHLVKDSAFGSYNKLFAVAFLNVVQQRSGRADVVGQQKHRSFTFRVGDKFSIGVFVNQCYDLFHRIFFVYHTGAVPQNHFAAGNAVDVVAQVFVGGKNQFLLFWETFDNLFCIGRGTNNIRHCFQIGSCVNISNYFVVGVFCFEFGKLVGRGRFCQRATGF